MGSEEGKDCVGVPGGSDSVDLKEVLIVCCLHHPLSGKSLTFLFAMTTCLVRVARGIHIYYLLINV
jgi:hypothetical protein